MSACVLVSWAPEATEKSTRIPTPTNRLNSARGSHHTLPDRPRSTASRISRSLCKLRRIRPDEAGQPISGRALSCRDVEDLLAERGLDVSYETVRRWVLKFGPLFARELRRRPRPTSRWHLDEMAVTIA